MTDMEETVKKILQAIVAVATAFWMLFWVLHPTESGTYWMSKLDHVLTSTTSMGVSGPVFVLQAFPVIVIVILSFILVELNHRNKFDDSKSPQGERKVSYLKKIVFIRSPLGTLTNADMLFIATISSLVLWFFSKDFYNRLQNLTKHQWQFKLMQASISLGNAGLLPLALLWLPVSRTSPVLRAFDIPYEDAVKYHKWMGMLAIVLELAHAFTFVIFLSKTGGTSHIFMWKPTGTSGIAAFSATICMALILATSLTCVRRACFKLFYVVHHLYVPTLLFFIFHTFQVAFFVAIPALLFFLDRFMRILQSQRSATVLSAKVLASGVMELKFAHSSGTTYHPLSFLFLRIPSVALFEWHPFSVTSSPLDGTGQVSICIKPLGPFTNELHSALINARMHRNACNSSCPWQLKASADCFYGHESDFYLNYTTLVLIAGGIGVTPFLAILRDILHRIRLRQQCLPAAILLVLCVKHPKDLAILNTLDPREILSDYDYFVDIKIHAYVTSTESPEYATLEDQLENPHSRILELPDYLEQIAERDPPIPVFSIPQRRVQEIAPLAITANNLWIASATIMTIAGFILVWGEFNVVIIQDQRYTYPYYKQALIFQTSIAVAVVVFGGSMLLLWYLCQRWNFQPQAEGISNNLSSSSLAARSDGKGKLKVSRSNVSLTVRKDLESTVRAHQSSWQGILILGRRPVWSDLFSEVAKQYAGQNVGVLISGNKSMQMAVAEECQRHITEDTSISTHSITFEF